MGCSAGARPKTELEHKTDVRVWVLCDQPAHELLPVVVGHHDFGAGRHELDRRLVAVLHREDKVVA